MSNQKTKKAGKKALKAGLIGGAVTLLVYFMIFRIKSFNSAVIALALSALIGWAVSVMSQGLDTSKPAPKQQKEPIPETGNEYADGLIKEGLGLLEEIRQENDKIPDVHLTEKIDELEDLLDRIFRSVADDPDKARKIRRSVNYYLPTTLKMLRGYREMDQKKVEGEKVDQLRQQIHQGMDMVVQAFRRQLDTMHDAQILDISTDIEAMNTILKSEGLLESDLKTSSETEKIQLPSN